MTETDSHRDLHFEKNIFSIVIRSLLRLFYCFVSLNEICFAYNHLVSQVTRISSVQGLEFTKLISITFKMTTLTEGKGNNNLLNLTFPVWE